MKPHISGLAAANLQLCNPKWVVLGSGGSGRECPKPHASHVPEVSWMVANFRKINSVKTPCGREILRKSMFSDWSKQIRNYPIQSGSSEVLLAAMPRVKAALEGLDAKMVLCVHDEIILEVAEKDAEDAGKALVSAMMEGFLDIFPEGPVEGLVDMKQGKTWAEIS